MITRSMEDLAPIGAKSSIDKKRPVVGPGKARPKPFDKQLLTTTRGELQPCGSDHLLKDFAVSPQAALHPREVKIVLRLSEKVRR
jgi:hypothetical protein